MTDRITILEAIHTRLADAALGGTLVVDDPLWVGVLTSMAPDPETIRRGNRWVESRHERLEGGRALFAVISRDGDGQSRVTAHSDAWTMGSELRRIAEDILGRPRGVRIQRMNALELLHRTVVNDNGAVFHVGGLYLNARNGRIVIDLLELDDEDNPIPGTECGLETLEGWHVH
ncbi:hypothetical protein IN07_01320 [Modestobacter caceresii]|uniref:Uncharacterized protein n=1 Tax=Modestobacter caceresii TaxID=1522368 RepID=A0A098YDY2_9ACTN|nr:hypothetical protein [Modestobacter caceresii]KGH48630.1 hypothetical protein IN07_01320 [Modestobacter caceresii]